LHLWASLGNGLDGVWPNGVDDLGELVGLDRRKVACSLDLDLRELCLVVELHGLALLELLHGAPGLDGGGLCLERRLLDGSLSLDCRGGSKGAGLCRGLTRALDRSALGLKLEKLLACTLGFGLVGQLLAFEAAAGLLVEALSLLAGCGLLRLGCDLDGQLDRLLERVACALVDGLHRLDIDVGHDQVV